MTRQNRDLNQPDRVEVANVSQPKSSRKRLGHFLADKASRARLVHLASLIFVLMES